MFFCTFVPLLDKIKVDKLYISIEQVNNLFRKEKGTTMKKRVFVVSEMSVIANNMNEAENIYRSMHACMDNYERCKNENENKVSDSNTEYEKRFNAWIKNLHPIMKEENKRFHSFTHNADDTINAYNDYIKELNDSDLDYDKQVLANILSKIEKPYEIPCTKYERKNISFPLPNMDDIIIFILRKVSSRIWQVIP